MYRVCHLGGHKKKPRFMHAPHNSHANLGRPLFNGVYSGAVLDLMHTWHGAYSTSAWATVEARG